MRIVFIGTVEMSQRSLKAILGLKNSAAEVVGVCTLAVSTFNADHVDLKPLCDEYGIPCHHVEDINGAETLGWVQNKKPDVIFCFGWSRLLKQELLDLAPMGVVGYHPAALPANRGRHPLIWALVLGLKETASTFFFMDAGADSGDILSQYPVTIADEDNARTLYDKIAETVERQITEFVPALVTGSYSRIPQDHSEANTWRKRGPADGKIDWRMSSQSVNNLVRGLARPYVGAHFDHDGQSVKVWKAQVVHGLPENIEPGKVVELSADGPVVKCGVGALCLLEMEPMPVLMIGNYL